MHANQGHLASAGIAREPSRSVGGVAASGNRAPSVLIIMATFNGGRFIDEQLASLADQTHTHWRLVVSDDGSSDDTLDRVAAFAERCAPGQVVVRAGPRRGFALNFLDALCDPSLDADFFAFCDQDDRWYPDRLARSLAALDTMDPATPALYAARTRLVDQAGRPLGHTMRWTRPPSFSNALVQSLAGGNTMTMNRAACARVRAAGPVPVPAHDWWVYLVVTACGGVVHYDPRPSLDYRQHDHNLIGAGRTWLDRLRRNVGVMVHEHRSAHDAIEQALTQLADHMSPDSYAVWRRFAQARRQASLRALWGVWQSGVYRQTRLGHWALWVAALAGWL